MARVTVEDCIVQVPNRFELVLFAAQRARDISAGAQITLDRDRDKNPVVALREIADELDPGVFLEGLADLRHPEACRREQARGGQRDGRSIRAGTGRGGAGPRVGAEAARQAPKALHELAQREDDGGD